MNSKRHLLALPLIIAVSLCAGCRTHSNSGGSYETYNQPADTGYDTSLRDARDRVPGASPHTPSPTFRPGLHPDDIRDPSSVTWPRPDLGVR